MPANEKIFADTAEKAVTESLRDQPWYVYPPSLVEVRPFGGEARKSRSTYDGGYDASVVVHLPNFTTCEYPAPQGKEYRPLRPKKRGEVGSALFLEFARLWDGGITRGTWREWIHTYGALGLNGGNPRGGGRETYAGFAQEAREAHEILRLYEAAENPKMVDEAYIRGYFYPMEPPAELGPPRNTALHVVGVRVQEKLSKECFPQLYHREGGGYVLSYGFKSLLGAMYLQFSFVLAAGTTAARWCKNCYELIPQEANLNKETCGDRCRKAISRKDDKK